jgi:RNA:NAD 2'-phosphotransferase (TPT1/KptA family)
MSSNQHYTRLPTLFPTQKEAARALDVGLSVLQGGNIKKDEDGFCLIEDLCQAIKDVDNTFGYMNRNHVIEFFFRDVDRKFLISGVDHVKYKDVRYVQPPDTLFFGTVENFVPKMKVNGIRSNTKGYVKLYSTPQQAQDFAKKFAREGEKLVAIKIDSKKAFSDGLKFSTFQDDEYIAVQIHSRYII